MFGSGDMMSADNIEAMFNSGNESTDKESELTPEEQDVIGEIGNISMGAAATVLHSLLQHEVNITTPRVSITTLYEISKKFEKPCLLVEVEYTSGLKGVNLFIVSDRDAKIIANLMLGGDGTDIAEGDIGEMELSAIGEAMNQMMGSSATAMSTVFEQQIDISPPSVEFISIENKLQGKEHLTVHDQVVQTEFNMSVGNLIDSSIMVLADTEFTRNMVKKLLSDTMGESVAHSPKEGSEEILEPAMAVHVQDEAVPPPPLVKAQPVVLEDFSPANKPEKTKLAARDIGFLQDIPLQVAGRLGCARMTIKEVLALGKGSVLELDRLAGEDVDLLVYGKLVA